LVKGKTSGIEATTLEANAALRSIVRRDTGATYQKFRQRQVSGARAYGICVRQARRAVNQPLASP